MFETIHNNKSSKNIIKSCHAQERHSNDHQTNVHS